MSNLKLFTTITTYGKKTSVLLEWITVSSSNDGFFTVEKSKNGKIFKAVGKVKKEGKTGAEAFYLYVDEAPLSKGFYRLKDSENTSRSNVVEVNISKKAPAKTKSKTKKSAKVFA